MSHMRTNIVQRVGNNANLLAPASSTIRSAPLIFGLGLAFKPEFVDMVSKIMMVAIFEIGNKVLNVALIEDEGTTRREMQVSSDLVNTNTPRDVATFGILFMNFVSPTLSNALG